MNFHAPQRPYSPIDALNRRSAALGSPKYGQLAAHADYNGHHVAVRWNACRRYYVAGYMWAGHRVIARGDFADCLQAALREYSRGALGASVAVEPREDDAGAIALCEASEVLQRGEAVFPPNWYTWRHECATQCARDSAAPGRAVMIFDWGLLQAAESAQVYTEALRAKHGRAYH